MSDYIFSSIPVEKDALTSALSHIYLNSDPKCIEFHGGWGSLAVSEGLYFGFQPYETQEHLIAIIGGPLLKFSGNEFLAWSQNGFEGTKRIYDRWLSGQLRVENDLSGPFVILVIDKVKNKSLVITDLMNFIPVWSLGNESEGFVHSSYVDAIAMLKKFGQRDLDAASAAEFTHTGVVTYPHSMYRNIYQLPPASQITFDNASKAQTADEYYRFDQIDFNSDVDLFGAKLNRAVKEYVSEATEYFDDLALFISGGEDSRAVLSFLPQEKNRSAFIFLDEFNREGRIAEKAAKAYGASFKLITRDRLNYLKIIKPASRLVGSGGQYFHAHTYNYSDQAGLRNYGAVFGGFAADRLLKGEYVKKSKVCGLLPFLPQFQRRKQVDRRLVNGALFSPEIRSEIQRRHANHLAQIQAFRPDDSVVEWSKIWPSSMALGAPNTHANRRLFRSYEPFFDNEVVKLSATIPVSKKLNRRVYHSAMKRQFAKSKSLRHANGCYPYLSKWSNIPIHGMFWFLSYLKRKMKPSVNDGPWGDWRFMVQSDLWKEWEDKACKSPLLPKAIETENFKEQFSSFSPVQKVNAFHLLELIEGLNYD